MYTKDEASQLKQAFWTTFGQYIAPQLSAESLKINWINYKTGLKYVYFKMDADKYTATISIEITHPDVGIQELFFEQFAEFKSLLRSALGEDWKWELHHSDENGKVISRIFKQINGVSIFNKNDWPELISFFKPRIIARDEFWVDVQEGFDGLR